MHIIDEMDRLKSCAREAASDKHRVEAKRQRNVQYGGKSKSGDKASCKWERGRKFRADSSSKTDQRDVDKHRGGQWRQLHDARLRQQLIADRKSFSSQALHCAWPWNHDAVWVLGTGRL